MQCKLGRLNHFHILKKNTLGKISKKMECLLQHLRPTNTFQDMTQISRLITNLTSKKVIFVFSFYEIHDKCHFVSNSRAYLGMCRTAWEFSSFFYKCISLLFKILRCFILGKVLKITSCFVQNFSDSPDLSPFPFLLHTQTKVLMGPSTPTKPSLVNDSKMLPLNLGRPHFPPFLSAYYRKAANKAHRLPPSYFVLPNNSPPNTHTLHKRHPNPSRLSFLQLECWF